MDKKYLDTLKNIELRPEKIKIKEKKEVLLTEQNKMEALREIFSQSPAFSDLPAGLLKDMQILRTAIIAEYDAVNLYEQMAVQASDENIVAVLKDIANEEKQHIGEFEFLLEHIDPMHETSENEGEEEAKEVTGLGEPPGEED
jgi:hypothetical protein